MSSPLNVSYAEFFRFMLQFLCLHMCVCGGSAVPQGGGGGLSHCDRPPGGGGGPSSLGWGTTRGGGGGVRRKRATATFETMMVEIDDPRPASKSFSTVYFMWQSMKLTNMVECYKITACIRSFFFVNSASP